MALSKESGSTFENEKILNYRVTVNLATMRKHFVGIGIAGAVFIVAGFTTGLFRGTTQTNIRENSADLTSFVSKGSSLEAETGHKVFPRTSGQPDQRKTDSEFSLGSKNVSGDHEWSPDSITEHQHEPSEKWFLDRMILDEEVVASPLPFKDSDELDQFVEILESLGQKYNPGAIEASHRPVKNAENLNEGQIVQVKWGDQWWAGEITSIQGQNEIGISYIGWDERWNETVPLDRLQEDPHAHLRAALTHQAMDDLLRIENSQN